MKTAPVIVNKIQWEVDEMDTKRRATSGEMTTKERLSAAKEAYWAAGEEVEMAHEAENVAAYALLAAYMAEYPDET